MLARVKTATVLGLDGIPIDVEVDIGHGLPGIQVLGLSDSGAREGRDRVRSALRNAGFECAFHKVTVNLAPVSVRKEGAYFDLPIALGLLAASGQLADEAHSKLGRFLIVGELGLEGSLRPVRGTIAMAILARDSGLSGVLVPRANAAEAALVKGIESIGVGSVREAASFLSGHLAIEPARPPVRTEADPILTVGCLSDIKGQHTAKRALVLAAAGRHNVLMIGPPGAGKTMLARRLQGLFPPLRDEEALEVTRVHSIAGVFSGGALITDPPFRAPHHTSTEASLVGGGKPLRPGEISLAHRGVLFLDELPEFGSRKLDTLRQPLEEGSVTIGRASGTVQFPSQFLCIAAMNPCPCGNFSADRPCRCSRLVVERYSGRVSGPLRDRFDLLIDIKRVSVRALTEPETARDPQWTTAAQRARVIEARNRQLQRQGKLNSELRGKETAAFAVLGKAEARYLAGLAESKELSARKIERIRRVARTSADLDGSPDIGRDHLLDALMQQEDPRASDFAA